MPRDCARTFRGSGLAQRGLVADDTTVLDKALLELAVLFALCVGVAVTFHRLRLPPIVGFLFAGVIVGPNGIGLVQHEAMVRELAQVGIVVLLFAVGLEVPLRQVSRLRRTILLVGGVQVVGTTLAGAAACWLAGLSWQQSIFFGFLLSQSSTAAVTKLLVDRGDFSTPHGRQVLGINIAQDLAVVPMILLIPLLAGSDAAASGKSLGGALLDFGVLCVVLVAVRFALGPIVELVCRTRSRELFVLLLATLCLGMAVVTSYLGLSLALGAFLAGVLLADSERHGQAAAEIEPFRDAFASLFFVSMGLLFDWRVVVEAPVAVTLALLAVVIGKAAIVMLAIWGLGHPFWVRLRAAFALAQVGEFSFVLAQLGRQVDLLSADAERIFVVVAVASIASTPLLYSFGAALARRARGHGEHEKRSGAAPLEEHAIVVGYGPTGRTVVQALTAMGIPVIASEMNGATVRAEKQKGMPVVLGDATRVAVLKALGIERAHLLVLAVNDVAATTRIAQLARQLAPNVHIVARAIYNAEVDELRRAGAHEVVPQELEASVEMLVRVLRRFLVADDDIGRRVREIRRLHDGDRVAEVAPGEFARIADFVPGINFAIWRVAAGSPAAGSSLAQAAVRRRTGCSVVALRRDGRNLSQIVPETMLEPGDTVVVLGPEERLPEVAALFRPPASAQDGSNP